MNPVNNSNTEIISRPPTLYSYSQNTNLNQVTQVSQPSNQPRDEYIYSHYGQMNPSAYNNSSYQNQNDSNDNRRMSKHNGNNISNTDKRMRRPIPQQNGGPNRKRVMNRSSYQEGGTRNSHAQFRNNDQANNSNNNYSSNRQASLYNDNYKNRPQNPRSDDQRLISGSKRIQKMGRNKHNMKSSKPRNQYYNLIPLHNFINIYI